MHQRFGNSSSNKWIISNNGVDHFGILEELRENEVHIGESSSEIKEVKEMVEGLAQQIASLSTAKSTE